MSEALALEYGKQALQVALLVAAPLLAVSLVVGIVVSLFQVATSLQDATLTFVPKIFAVGIAMLLLSHWMTQMLVDFTHRILASIPDAVG